MNQFLWCEDSKSGYRFWKAILNELFPEIIVESKGGNARLRKALNSIDGDGNKYYIIMDTAVDNPDVLRETKKINEIISGKDYIHVIQVHSFEHAILSFEFLEQWVFAKVDELKKQRQTLLDARTSFLSLTSSSAVEGTVLEVFKEAYKNYKNKNTEQIAANLLFEITRNTGFETDKSKLGECFINSCCEWVGRQSDDICGLNERRISANEKARMLVDYSELKESFEKVGL